MHRLLIRADANSQIGHGHLMRCLALAQAWRAHAGPVTFVMASPSSAIANRLHSEGMELVELKAERASPDDLQQTKAAAQRLVPGWIVLDGYDFSSEYQAGLRRTSRLLMVDDGIRSDRFDADILLNQNIHAAQELYNGKAAEARLLLGCEYVLLRREFLMAGKSPRQINSPARKVLLTMGGSDAENVTAKVLRGLIAAAAPDTTVRVIAGGSNPNLERLRELARTAPFAAEVMVDVHDMPAQMSWADLAISAGGSTCWEMAFMGLPAIVTAISRDQTGIVAGLGDRGVALNLGWHQGVSEREIAQVFCRVRGDDRLLRRMSVLGRELVDGRGAERVVAAMEVGA